MTIIVICGAITVTGVYLRWATGPVLAAYQVGRHIERLLTGTRAQSASSAPITADVLGRPQSGTPGVGHGQHRAR